jgi:predicted site-specific integrase-resolvase
MDNTLTLTPRQAARRLGVCTRTFHRWIRDQNVSPEAVYRLGSSRSPRYRIEAQEIERIKREGLYEGCAATQIPSASSPVV